MNKAMNAWSARQFFITNCLMYVHSNFYEVSTTYVQFRNFSSLKGRGVDITLCYMEKF